MDIAKVFNIFEVVLWIAIGLSFFVISFKNRNISRASCLILSIAFIAFGLSDYVEIQTGAWWQPWWLLVWKAVCIMVFAITFGFFLKRKK